MSQEKSDQFSLSQAEQHAELCRKEQHASWAKYYEDCKRWETEQLERRKWEAEQYRLHQGKGKRPRCWS